MARELKNKIVAVTGAAEGIGFEIADKFLDNGAELAILLDINEEVGGAAEKSLIFKHGNGKAVFIKCDVSTDMESVYEEIIIKYKTIDVLVNNAAIVDETSVRKTIEVNLIAVMEWTMKFWQHMRTDTGGNGGTIMNLASINSFRIDPFLYFYKASKFGVMGFTKSFGHEYNFKRYGVRVVAICPGFTDTRLGLNAGMPDPEVQADYEATVRNDCEWQKVEAAGNAAVAVFNTADSGTAWLIEGSKPIEKV